MKEGNNFIQLYDFTIMFSPEFCTKGMYIEHIKAHNVKEAEYLFYLSNSDKTIGGIIVICN